ncbi:MAG: hypothetical protein LBH82_05680 [Bacteroidales bacterium]|nr:hypothetical protein [Bacteroidales bacterium]
MINSEISITQEPLAQITTYSNDNKTMPSITEILPRYTQLNALISEISDSRSIEFEQQRFVADFHAQFSDIQPFETMLIDLVVQTEAEQSRVLLKSLDKEIQRNVQLISANKQTFENIDVKQACEKFAKQHDTPIANQIHITQEIWKEYKKVDNSLYIIGFRIHTEQEEKRLWEKHEELTKRYKDEKKVLSLLYEQQKEAENTAQKYLDNKFQLLLSLSQIFSEILEKYLPKAETTPQSGAYFDMSLISAIHKECNDEQFENISELDLYAVLNLLPSSEQFVIKNGERNRVYYLIHKLYERLPKENNQAWRTAILQSLQLKERTYLSKYRTAKGENTTPELEKFADNLDELFKEFES